MGLYGTEWGCLGMCGVVWAVGLCMGLYGGIGGCMGRDFMGVVGGQKGMCGM